jgi:cobalamin biosynthesis protein CobD/CbiB
MAKQPLNLSRRDEVYLNSPGFEPFMGAGAAFVVVFTAIFLVSLKIGLAWLAWPGMFVAALVCYLVLSLLQRREYARKVAELTAEQERRPVTPR